MVEIKVLKNASLKVLSACKVLGTTILLLLSAFSQGAGVFGFENSLRPFIENSASERTHFFADGNSGETDYVLHSSPSIPFPAPVDLTVCAGSPATFTATAGLFSYQWWESTDAGASWFPRADFAQTLTIPSATVAMSGHWFRCRVDGIWDGSAILTVNPLPTLSSVLNPPAICSNAFFSYTPTSATAGTTFSWFRAAIGGILNPAASGSFNPNEPLNNTTTAPITVTYAYSLTANGCTNPSLFNVKVIVNPTPQLTSTLNPAAICSGTAFSYMPTSSTTGTIFNWSRAVVAGISNVAGAGTDNPNEILVNTTASPVSVVYAYTLVANGCSNSYNVTVVVNPTPALSSLLAPPDICSGSTFSYNPTSATPGASFAWSRAVVAGISNPSASGAGNPNEALVNTGAIPVNVTYIYSVSANGCNNPTNFSVVVTVNPSPTLTSSLSPPAICNNAFFSYTPNSSTAGVTFAWNRVTVPGISNGAASGTGNPNEPLTNSTASPVNATYVYTLSANGCTNPTTFGVVVAVNPAPALTSSASPPPVCSGTAFSYTPTSSTAGTTYAWSRAAVAGISNAVANGTDNPNEVLVNTTSSPVTVTYVYTLNAAGCTSTANVLVSVNPTPTLSSTLTPPSICSGGVFSYNPTSLTAGASFGWSRAVVAGISNGSASGTGNPNESLISNSALPVVVSYVYSVSANGCSNPVTYNVAVTVNPTPTLTSQLAPPSICSGTVFSYSPASGTAGTTFSWSRAVAAGLSNASSSGLGDPNEILNNTTTAPVNATYAFTLSANGCANPVGYSVVVAVNPVPVLTSGLNPPDICSGTSFSYAPVSSTAGTTFTWVRSVVAGISNSASAGSDNPNEVLINTTSLPVNVTYVYTLTANGCSNNQNVIVKVNPTPALTSILNPPGLCSGASFSYVPTSSTAGASFAWTRAIIAGISNPSSSGFGNPNETLINTSINPVVVTYVFTVTANGCSSSSIPVTVTVNPSPVLNTSLTPPAICSGTTFSYAPSSATAGTVFNWSRAAVSGISNVAASGTDNPNENLVNITSSPVTVTYVYTLVANGCGNVQNVAVVVNPTPVLSSTLTPAAICSGTVFSYAPASVTAGATYGWSRAAVAGISNAASSGLNNPNETLVSTSITPVVVTYVYTIGANGCSNSQNVTVTVNPSPTLTSLLAPPAICTGSAFSYTPTSSTAGTAFGWSRTVVPGITNAASSGFGNPNEPLNNSTASPVSATYDYTLSANGCTNLTIYHVVVAVNPTAVLSSSLTPPDICSGSSFIYIPTSSTPGTTFNWSRAVVSGISNVSATGTDNPNEILTNVSSAPVFVTYVYTLNAGGCSSTFNVVVKVNPAPVLSSSLAPPAICSGTLFSYIPSSATSGATFSWSRAAVANISNVAASGIGNPNETLLNTGIVPVTVTYVYTVAANGCSSSQNVIVTVNPTPTLTSLLAPPSICSGTVFSYLPTSSTAGATFSWSRGVVAGISNAASSGMVDPAETLINTTSAAVNVTYVYSLSANGCTNPLTYNVIVAVNPTPILTSSTNPPAICSGNVFSYTPTSSTFGVTFGWSRAVVAGISNPAASGSDNPNENLVNTTAAPVNVVYVYTLSAGGCLSTYNVTAVVDPTPVLSSPLIPPAICSGTVFSYTPASATGLTSFAWSRGALAGISNVAASGSGNPNETLVNTTAAPIDVTYIYTLTANGCSKIQNVTVKVNPTPTLNSSLLLPAICSGSALSYTPTSATSGASFAWTRAAVPGISNAASSGFGDPNETLVNTNTIPVTVTYIYTVSANGCTNPVAYNVLVNVNPMPILTSNLFPAAICSGTTFNYSPTCVTPGVTYAWSRAAVVGISNISASGFGNPSEALINTTASPIAVTYVYTLTANGCSNVQNVMVTVNPAPILTSSLAPPSICSGASFSYSPTSSTAGTAFAWSRTVVAGISNPLGNGTGNPNESLINTSSAPINVTYVYSLTANGCTNPATFNVVVVVNPTVTLTSSLTPPDICSGASFTYAPTSSTVGTVFNWSRAVVSGISELANNGIGNPNESLTNTTALPINVTYVYNLVANGCSNAQNVTVKVNPTPILNSSLTPPAICSGSLFTYNPSSITGGTIFGWSRAAVAGISNSASSGFGNPNEILVNTSSAPVNVTYLYTLTANGCSNSQSVVVLVNPNPTLTSLLFPPAVCTGSVFSYTPASATVGATFAWNRAAVAGISNASSSGLGDPNETLINTSTAPVTVTYIYSVSANGCTNGSNYNVSVVVNPSPILTSSLNPPAICSGAAFSYTPLSSTLGTTFSWSRAFVAGISNAAAGGTNNPNEALVNTTLAPVNVVYVYTLNAGGCSSTYNVTAVVNPSPILTSSLSPPAICSGTVFNYVPTSGTLGTIFNWSRSVVAGISNPASSGLGDPNETLTNSGSATVNVTYVYSLNANGCTNPTTYNVIVPVNPTPVLTSTLLPPAICSGSLFTYTTASSTVGAAFSWSRSALAGISNAAANGLGNPNEALQNTTAAPITVTYVYSVSANGCNNPATYNVSVVVNPLPVLTSSLLPASICSGSTFNYTPTSTTVGVIYGWTRATVVGISNAASSGANDPNEVLVNTTASPLDVTYVYTLTANGCSNIQNVTVRVNPKPFLSSSLTPPATCSGVVFSYTPLSLTAGVSYSWTRAFVVGVSNLASVGVNSPNEILINTTSAPVTVNYVYTLSANGCNNSQTVSVVVSPTPVLSSGLIPPAVCSGDVFSYNPTSNTTGVTFNWSRGVVAGISNPAASGTNNPIETLVNTTALPVVVTYIYTLSGNGCVNTQNVTVSVNPLPTLSSSLTPPAVCNNSVFSYAPTSANGIVTGWTRAAVGGISNAGTSGAGNPNETLVNTTNAPINVTYVYTLSATGCSNTQNVVVQVNPTPAFTSSLAPPSICSNTTFSYTPTSTTAGAVFAWNRPNVAGISNPTANNTGNPGEVLINTTNLPVTVTYTYTISINGCANPVTYDVKVSVIPSSLLTSTLTPPAVCSNTPFTYTPTVLPVLTAGTTFAWDRAAVAGISNPPSSGTNGINETLINTSAFPVDVTYIYTLTYGGCSNTQNVVVTINPTPTLSSLLAPPDICSGTVFSYTPTSLTPLVNFAWTRAVVAGISNLAGAGANNPNEILTNTTALPIVVTYVYTLNVNGCSKIYNIPVTVDPKPTLSSSLSPPNICSNTEFSYTPTSLTPGATFAWSRAVVAGVSNLASLGTDNPHETLINTTTAPVTVTYVYTLTIGGCTNSQNVLVVVNPSPILSSTLTPAAVCNNTTFSYTATSATAGTTFAWSRAAVAGISNIAASGVGNVNETLVNTSTLPINVTYTYSLTANTCSNPQNVTVSVNPTPLMTSSLTPADICSNSAFNYAPISSTPGTIFNWTRAAVAGISNGPAAGVGNPNEILVNTTFLPLAVKYIFSLSINGCANPVSYLVTVNVIPSSVLTSGLGPISVCSNSIFSYNHTESIPGTTISWIRALTPGISNAAASGTGNIAEILYNTTALPVDVNYVFTLSYGGCTNTQNVVARVQPLPVLSSTLTPDAICSNTSFDYLPTSGSALTTFAWTRPVVAGISNVSASGTDNPHEVLVNTTTLPINVTYVYTLTSNGCSNVQNVVVAVDPSPILTSTLTPASICSNSVFSYIPTSSSTGVTFNWTRGSVAGISNAATFGVDNPNETLINTSTAPVTVTYLYTLSANGCTNPTTYQVTVVVNPVPALISSLVPPAICSGTNFSYTPNSSVAGTVFNWSRALVAGISNGAASSTGNPNEILINTSNAPVVVTYVYTLSANGCTNPSVFNVVVTVNPSPVLTSTVNPADVCSGTAFSYTPTGSVSGTSFAWTRAVVAGISNLVGAGNGNPNEILVNTTALPVVVSYIYTLSANGCTNPSTFTVNVTVNPFPTLTSTLTPTAVCSGSVFNYTPTSLASGTVFSWTRAVVAGISNASGSGTGVPNETLVNTTTSPVTVTYA